MDCVRHHIIGSKRHRTSRLSFPRAARSSGEPNRYDHDSPYRDAESCYQCCIATRSRIARHSRVRPTFEFRTGNCELTEYPAGRMPDYRRNCDPLTSLTIVMPLEMTVDQNTVLV